MASGTALQPPSSAGQCITHPDVLLLILSHLPTSALPPLLRVSRAFHNTDGPLVYRHVTVDPDVLHRGPLVGVDTAGDKDKDATTGQRDRPCQHLDLNRKRWLLQHTEHLTLVRHSHDLDDPHDVFHRDPPRWPRLRTLRLSNTSPCSLRSLCPVLQHALPRTMVLPVYPFADKKARHPISIPCAHTIKRVVYLCEAPYDVALDPDPEDLFKPETAGIPTQIFIFKPKTYGHVGAVKSWAPAIYHACTRDAMTNNLARLCLQPAAERIFLVGTEYIKSDVVPVVRSASSLEQSDGEDKDGRSPDTSHAVVMRYHRTVVLAKVREIMAELGKDEDEVQRQLDRVEFVSLRQWVDEDLDDEVIPRSEALSWL